MIVLDKATGEKMNVSPAYGLRLIEQNKAVAAPEEAPEEKPIRKKGGRDAGDA